MVLTRSQKKAAEHDSTSVQVSNSGGSKDDTASTNTSTNTSASVRTANDATNNGTANGHGQQQVSSCHSPTIPINSPKNESTTASDTSTISTTTTPTITKVAMILIVAITIMTFPKTSLLQPSKSQQPSVSHVWYFGWISALSTGLGVLPLVLSPTGTFNTYWVGVTNAIAAGMMIAASYSLIIEGFTFNETDDTSTIPSSIRTILGSILGLIFILSTKSFLDDHEELKVGGLAGADAKKVLLIIFVMTLHSFSEGIGIGVSFGGSNGHELGVFISASLAVHNVPEGLAVAIVLLPRNVSKLSAALWCIVTSLPQPLMAVPAFLFVHAFIPFLPVGLGFAGGAMAWVAVCELLMEAYEDTKSLVMTGVISTVALYVMLALQGMIDEGSRG